MAMDEYAVVFPSPVSQEQPPFTHGTDQSLAARTEMGVKRVITKRAEDVEIMTMVWG